LKQHSANSVVPATLAWKLIVFIVGINKAGFRLWASGFRKTVCPVAVNRVSQF
jgi:hypothetical protein